MSIKFISKVIILYQSLLKINFATSALLVRYVYALGVYNTI